MITLFKFLNNVIIKKNGAFVYLLLLVLFIYCQKESQITFGFDSPINKNSDGLVIAYISHNVKNVHLSGLIRLREGEVEVYLLNPNGIEVYSKTILAPSELNINETFEAEPGYWKLKYKSNEGLGEIDVHLHKY